MPIINPGTGGSPGPPGPQGIPGINGIPGFDGESGEDRFPIPGSQGAQGSQGIQGVSGINGSQGIPGEDGLSGEDSFIPGPQGLTGINGTNGAAGTAGARGLDGEDGLSSDDLWPGFNPFIDDPLEQISRIQDQNLAIRPSYSAIVVGPYTINSGKHLSIGSGGRFKIEQGAPDTKTSVFASQTSSAAIVVPGNSSNVEFMEGLGTIFVVTPKTSGTLLLMLEGDLQSTNLSTDILSRLYYGVGTAPAISSAPITSTRVPGNPSTITIAVATTRFSFSIMSIAKNLNINTTYWFDLSIAITSNLSMTITLNNVNFVALEQ